MNLSLIYNGGALANDLNNNPTTLISPTVSADSNIGLILGIETAPLTAFVTDVSFTQTPAGDGGFNLLGFTYNYELLNPSTYSTPFKLTNLASGSRNNVVVTLTATGAPNSNGRQDGVYVVTLSSFCLSGGAGADAVARVSVDNSPVTVFTTLTSALIPYASTNNGAPVTTTFSAKEAQRRRLLGYI